MRIYSSEHTFCYACWFLLKIVKFNPICFFFVKILWWEKVEKWITVLYAILVFFFFLFIFKISRSVSFAGSSGSVPGRWTASCLCISSLKCSFPYWFPFKCDAWQSSLFHFSHVSVPISFSMSSPSYDILHPTLFPNVSVPNSVQSCFSHYSPERFHFD